MAPQTRANIDPSGLKLLPTPRFLNMLSGTYRPVKPVISLSAAGAPLKAIILREWASEFSVTPEIKVTPENTFSFCVGKGNVPDPDMGDHPELYTLTIESQGISAHANRYNGLVHAWQTLKQIMRHNASEVPCLRIRDWPDLPWRIYHLDLKGTRRKIENLHALLPQIAELKVNALLVEYEDYVKLDRHPSLAVSSALTKQQVREWVTAASDYGISIVPLVQTLGHWQYVLRNPAYSELQEKPGEPSEGCSSNPKTWELAKDFLEEIMELHPRAPFIHVGLDETFHIGTCPRCVEKLAGRSRVMLYVEWVNRICRLVREKGFTPIVWGDVIGNELDHGIAPLLDQNAVYVDWGYTETGPTSPWMRAFKGRRISRSWLERPNGEISGQPNVGINPGVAFFEDLPPADRERLKPLLDNPDFPRKFNCGISLALFEEAQLRRGAISGIRVSYHGNLAPRFMTGQLNTLFWARQCKKHKAEMLLASSWSRGHSLAGMNAHPELDWYGIATLGEAGWSPLDMSGLRDFDMRFGFQFFGLPDGRIGDLYYMSERSSTRVDHGMDNYTAIILDECNKMLAVAKRNRDRLELFKTVTTVQSLRYRAQFALLEIEYFYALWARVPADFKARMLRDSVAVSEEMMRVKKEISAFYGKTIVAEDAIELAETQLSYFHDSLQLMRKKMFKK